MSGPTRVWCVIPKPERRSRAANASRASASARRGVMARRTKIIATIGPASDSEAMITTLVEAGMDVARIGLAHGSLDEAIERVQLAEELGYARIDQVHPDAAGHFAGAHAPFQLQRVFDEIEHGLLSFQ